MCMCTDDKLITEAAKHYKTVFEETLIDEDLNKYKNWVLKTVAQNKKPPWSFLDVKFAIIDWNTVINRPGVAGAVL